MSFILMFALNLAAAKEAAQLPTNIETLAQEQQNESFTQEFKAPSQKTTTTSTPPLTPCTSSVVQSPQNFLDEQKNSDFLKNRMADKLNQGCKAAVWSSDTSSGSQK